LAQLRRQRARMKKKLVASTDWKKRSKSMVTHNVLMR
jgi:hypothetical protein